MSGREFDLKLPKAQKMAIYARKPVQIDVFTSAASVLARCDRSPCRMQRRLWELLSPNLEFLLSCSLIFAPCRASEERTDKVGQERGSRHVEARFGWRRTFAVAGTAFTPASPHS